jgi:HSP20 family protein
MDPVRRITFRWLHSGRPDVAYELASFQFSPPTWQPAINAFRCEKGLSICVDVAGVDRSAIDVMVEEERVVIRGNREAPEPTDAEGRSVQMLAMEIDYGPFERTVRLPAEVDVNETRAEQRNGLLWIHLPFKS